ncbi:MAG: NAD-dependent epimerase/dehydratase family protein, partial [Ideonella sp.]
MNNSGRIERPQTFYVFSRFQSDPPKPVRAEIAPAHMADAARSVTSPRFNGLSRAFAACRHSDSNPDRQLVGGPSLNIGAPTSSCVECDSSRTTAIFHYPVSHAPLMSRALITGIEGFTGRYMAESLRQAGHEVFGLSQRGSPWD